MKKRVYLIIIVLSILMPCSLDAQQKNIPSILEMLFERMMNSGNDSVRLALNDSIRIIVNGYVRSDTVFSYRFSNVRNLGQILSPDNRVKIVNWNLPLRDGSNLYHCYIVHKAERKGKNSVYELSGMSKREPVRSDKIYTADNWYGALYYAVQPFRKGKSTYYILLGIDYSNLRLTRKIIDILSFASDGKLVFGDNCLVNGKVTKYREVFEYTSESVMTLRILSPKLIVFDHLVSFSDTKSDNRENYGAEYTFDAYKYKKGMWTFARNIDVKNKK